MNRDDIIRMARETGLEQVVSIALDGTKIVSCPPLPELERFAALVAAAEREECAKLCDELANSESDHEAGGAIRIQNAIRARGQE